ncbi:MAG: hypothetical protein PF961_20520 [Planctomycetota bacterium]|jgi:succinate dehydrogenase / fumarate reductase membrane anchor subunit|nr:hypothetical protein [Planctomycetota bacterium]
MAGRPYTSSRSGKVQWMMQRVSAVLLLVLVFVHFGIQHFTSDAVTTGLTVAARFNSPYWQGFYILFVALGLYHGINGLIGIWYDYMQKPLARNVVAMLLWTAGAYFGGVAMMNIINPRPLAEVKTFYAVNGLAVGATRGNPPVAMEYSYDFRSNRAAIPLLRYYLEKHTHQDSEAEVDVEAIFGDAYQISAEDAPAIAKKFDRWLLDTIAVGDPKREAKGHGIFSSTYEFAVWAANVRKANAEADGTADVSARLAPVPAYSPTIH